MYPKSLVFALTLLSCMFLMASATPVVGGRAAPVKRLKQFQARDATYPHNDGGKRRSPSAVYRIPVDSPTAASC